MCGAWKSSPKVLPWGECRFLYNRPRKGSWNIRHVFAYIPGYPADTRKGFGIPFPRGKPRGYIPMPRGAGRIITPPSHKKRGNRAGTAPHQPSNKKCGNASIRPGGPSSWIAPGDHREPGDGWIYTVRTLQGVTSLVATYDIAPYGAQSQIWFLSPGFPMVTRG